MTYFSVMSRGNIDGSIRGAEAVIANFESILATFERSELIPTRYHEEGDSLVVEMVWRGVLPGSETPVEQRLACAHGFRDGLIVYTSWYPELADAVKSLGLTAPALQTARAGGPRGA
jgi:ketosteroid isomerase-like protein